ncbi:toxic anion resistance protein [Lysinibacillus sp. 54212]|uniref:toxic anion resistance protein n=1 Tax=Lysinibacillus sp. 54212 TaxID=3119829 RepID=UPI002FC766F3
MKSENPFEAFQSSGSSLAEAASEQYEYHLQNNAPTPLFLSLSTFDQKRAMKLAGSMNVGSYEDVLSFGLAAQSSLKSFTSKMLLHVQRKDTSQVGDILFQLMDHLEKVDPDALIEKEAGFFGRLFKKQHSSIQEIMTHFNRLSKHIDRLGIQLAHSQQNLLMDYNMLDELFKLNEDYFNEINIYIAAGEVKRQELQNEQLPVLNEKAQASNDPMLHQQLQDLQMALEWLDRRIYDLEISREIAVQSAPQIRLIQQTNRMLIDKIQSSIMTTIPLWQSQISMLVSMNNQRRANLAQQRLLQASDELMKKNAKMIKVTSQDKKGNRSIRHEEIDHFKQTQLRLLQDVEETLRVQAVANEKRLQTESELM